MGRISKSGLYTWDVRLGVLPRSTMIVGATPTGPIAAPVAPAGRGVGYENQVGNGVPRGVVQVLIAACTSAERLVVQSNRTDLVMPLRGMRGFLELALRKPNADGLIPSAKVKAAINSIANKDTAAAVRFFLQAAAPTVSFQQIVDRIDAGYYLGTRDRAALQPTQGVVPQRLQDIGPAAGGSGIGPTSTSPAANIIASGGNGAEASAVQTQTVLDANGGSGITPIVPATGPSASIPGYGVNPVAQQPSSSQCVYGVSADGQCLPAWGASWVKPALAVAICAAIGVGIGRAIAG